MIEIVKSSEYNVRIMKNPDFKKKVQGYNFSYPLMNSIDICNLFISGGSIEVVMNGQPKSIWSFDMDKLTFTIKQNNKEQKYTIDAPEELGEAMIKYFDANKNDVFEKNLDTNLKKSKSKLGNQNAKKENKEVLTDNMTKTPVTNSDNVHSKEEYDPFQRCTIVSPKRGRSDYCD